MSRRLVPADLTLANERLLREAVRSALTAQLGDVSGRMRAAGYPLSLVAGAAKKYRTGGAAAGAGLAIVVWDQTLWQSLVDEYVAPVAAAVAASSVGAAAGSVPASLVWGLAHSADSTSQAISDQASSAGEWIGERANEAVVASADPVGALTDVLSTATTILGTRVGNMAHAASNLATSDVTSYVAGYFGNVYTGATVTWYCVGDTRTRPSHLDATGQQVGLNESFQVGGTSLLCPGTPDGSTEETINCRCWIETDGLPDADTTPNPDFPGTSGQYPQTLGGKGQGSPADRNAAT